MRISGIVLPARISPISNNPRLTPRSCSIPCHSERSEESRSFASLRMTTLEKTMPTMNRQFKLAKRPVGMVSRDDFQMSQEPVPEPKDGEFVVKTLFISLDPAMRGCMNDVRSYVPPAQIGE